MKKIAFYDSKLYDINSFNNINKNYEIHYFVDKLNTPVRSPINPLSNDSSIAA